MYVYTCVGAEVGRWGWLVILSSLDVPLILFLSFLILCFVNSCTSCLDLSYADKSRWLKKMVGVG